MAIQIFNIALNDDIVFYTANHIIKLTDEYQINDILILTPSKRSALFLKKEMAKQINKAFVPPTFVTLDELVSDISTQTLNLMEISQMDSVYIIYTIVKEIAPQLLNKEQSFSNFFQWAVEILNFIEALDTEKISNDKLLNIKLNADIGYDIPHNINELLKYLYTIRKNFHDKLDSLKRTTRGYAYFNADSHISKHLENYKKIILFNPYYLNKSEIDMLKNTETKLDIILKGNPSNWNALEEIYKNFNLQDKSKNIPDKITPNINYYSAYDNQSQACLIKNLLEKMPKDDIKNTVIIVPDNSILTSVMSEIYTLTTEVNIATGYPASKTTVFSLFKDLLQAQRTRKNGKYYVSDFLAVLLNPLVKNIRFIGNPDVTRIIVHKIEETFDRTKKDSKFSGHSFIALEELINDTDLHQDLSKMISDYWQNVNPSKIKEIITQMFDLFFNSISSIKNLHDFSLSLNKITNTLTEKSFISKYPINLGAVNIINDIAGQFTKTTCKNEEFEQTEIFYIFEELLLKGNIPLIGSPLKNLQVLGFLEARGLKFKNVFILSMIDSIVPNIKQVNSLIPKDIMSALGIGYVSKDIEIQKYHFMSLIASSDNVSLIYPENTENTRSRFMEELIWNEQFQKKSLDVTNIIKATIENKSINVPKQQFRKTPQIKSFLKSFYYSATNIDTYMQCQLKFYYRYILKLKEQTDYDKNYENIELGVFIHDFLERTFYKNLTSTELAKNYDSYINLLDKTISDKFKISEDGANLLLSKIVRHKLNLFYHKEIERNNWTIIDTEKEFESKIQINNELYNLKAKIDRIDKTPFGNIIIDYKTGSTETPLNEKNILNNITTDRQTIQKAIKSFQLIIYKYLYETKTSDSIENCVLYSLKTLDFTSLFKENSNDKEQIYSICFDKLKYVISEINSDLPFKSESYDKTDCQNCPYFYLCR